MDGGLYYWAAAAGGIYRYDFGLRGQTAENFYTPTQAMGFTQCVGCHALSRNGTRIAVGLNAPGEEMRLLDVATRKTLFDQSLGGFGMGTGPSSTSIFEAITPDASMLITTEGGGLGLRDGSTGSAIGTVPALANATMPDISSDGKHVVFVRDGSGLGGFFAFGNPEVMKGSLFTAPLNATGFGGEKPLVQSGGENNYYPAFSPDNAWVVFNRAAGTSYDAMDAKVFAVSMSGGTPIEMATANEGMGNSWPKWAPFVHHFQGSTVFWITFSSRRPYGLHSGGTVQIWMAAIDPTKLTAGTDASYPAFWLPFQDATTGNHIPQWVEKIQRQPCTVTGVDQTGGCMTGETCQNGVCIPNIQ
jgi:hypothetical protein